jgi:hypothetical protein
MIITAPPSTCAGSETSVGIAIAEPTEAVISAATAITPSSGIPVIATERSRTFAKP